MIVEHLIEPDALVELAKSKRNCKDFAREFSKPSPRVIGEFPKLKYLRRLAFQAQSIDATELERLRLTELVAMIACWSRIERDELFEGGLTFQENLKNIERNKHQAIYLLSNDSNPCDLTSEILSVDHFNDGVESLPHQIAMAKVAETIGSHLGELLRLSKNITIVDPYFSTQPGVWKTFLLLLTHAIDESPVNNKSIVILFDGTKKSARSCKHLVKTLEDEKLPFLDQFSTITFREIKENGNEALHNRYIITELAAVSIPYGLQETNEHEFDDVTLLSEELYCKRVTQYIELKGVELVNEASS